MGIEFAVFNVAFVVLHFAITMIYHYLNPQVVKETDFADEAKNAFHKSSKFAKTAKITLYILTYVIAYEILPQVQSLHALIEYY